MRSRARGQAVGHFKCPSCGEVAILRRKANEKRTLYGFCGNCGMLNWTMPAGQRWFINNATMWKLRAADEEHAGEPIPPDDLPKWIRENRAWKPSEPDAVHEELSSAEVLNTQSVQDPKPTEPRAPRKAPAKKPARNTKPQPKPEPEKQSEEVKLPWM